MCAACGLARPAAAWVGLEGWSWSRPAVEPLRDVLSELSVGTNELGEFRRLAAPGHPHSYSDVPSPALCGELYAGREMLAWVALQERM
ncbi:hypothetical protein Tdes44962_MAKER00540 [Teratosphaeria destructans]|uniref:Uncharacterized protein n=1 Tax=Teratosphaeria destructans TaxID=418781 RepID=A0A9W7SPW3_9PEZI|nr:hypothetical protein Tdes44962_MAKER00540 [Teratosphaeria destructans]